MQQPYFHKARKTWFVWMGKGGDRHQLNLGKEKDEAFTKWHELMASKEPLTPKVAVVRLLDQFLDWVKRRRSERTYEWYLMHLQSFAKYIGKRLKVADLKPKHVTAWIDRKHPHDSPSTQHGAIRAVQRAFSWAEKEGHIIRSPVASVEKPTPVRREVYITDEQWKHVMDKATDQNERDLLTVFWETGIRVQEIRIIEARHFEEDNERIVFQPSQAKGHALPRVIYLNDKALTILKRLNVQHPEGPLFRNRLGRAWTKNSIRCRFRKCKIKGLCGTALRHTWATNALARGVDPITVSVLLGHTDVTTLSRHYAHLTRKPDYMREQVRKATDQGA